MMKWTGIVLSFALLTGGVAYADEAASKATYDKMCASCHGADGHGNAAKATMLKIDPKLLDFAREEAKAVPRADKIKALADGKGKMPAYAKKVPPAEIEPLFDYSMKLAGVK
jgi:mono/diheme cytochrome c family protein